MTRWWILTTLSLVLLSWRLHKYQQADKLSEKWRKQFRQQDGRNSFEGVKWPTWPLNRDEIGEGRRW